MVEFIRTFGEDELADGRTVRDVLKVLPADTSYQSVDAMFAEVSEREAVIVRTTVGAQSAVAAALGIEAELENVGDADIAMLAGVPTKAGGAHPRRDQHAGQTGRGSGRAGPRHHEGGRGTRRRRRRRRVDRVRPDAEQAALNGRDRLRRTVDPRRSPGRCDDTALAHRRSTPDRGPARGDRVRKAQKWLFTR
ncbi:hypothetical protein NKG94_11005 [Micromonospora sp. M12]